MPLEPPTSLSPSKVSTFRDCALAFRFSAIDRLPEPPSVPATKGTLVHRALELLFCLRPGDRTPEEASRCLEVAFTEISAHPDFTDLHLDDHAAEAFVADARAMVGRYFDLEDPRDVSPIGIELRLEVELGDLRLRGVIDRLELAPGGGLVVTDYKTGRAPSEKQERSRLGGVHFYAYMCERLFGARPDEVRLLYLGSEPQIIIARPSEQSTAALEKKVKAIWTAVVRSCERDDFRPNPSALCDWCAFRSYCPAFGGDPEDARVLAEAGA